MDCVYIDNFTPIPSSGSGQALTLPRLGGRNCPPWSDLTLDSIPLWLHRYSMEIRGIKGEGPGLPRQTTRPHRPGKIYVAGTLGLLMREYTIIVPPYFEVVAFIARRKLPGPITAKTTRIADTF